MKYATANSRKAVKWVNGDTTMEALRARFQTTVRTTETIEEYRNMLIGLTQQPQKTPQKSDLLV